MLANDTKRRRRPEYDRLRHPARQRHGHGRAATSSRSPISPTPTTATSPAPSPPTTSPTRCNGGSEATVAVTVDCADDAPVAVDDTKTVAEDSGASAIDVLANDTERRRRRADDRLRHPARPRHGHGRAATSSRSPISPTPTTATSPAPSPPTTSPTRSTAALRRPSRSPSTAPTMPRSPSTTPRPSARTPDASSIDVLANDPNGDAGELTIASATQPANGTVTVAPRRALAHLSARPRLLQRARRRAHRRLHLHAQRRL